MIKCEDKSNEIFIVEYIIILVAVKQVCVCYITKLTHYFRALISINGRNKFNYYVIELILLNLAATMYMTPM